MTPGVSDCISDFSFAYQKKIIHITVNHRNGNRTCFDWSCQTISKTVQLYNVILGSPVEDGMQEW